MDSALPQNSTHKLLRNSFLLSLLLHLLFLAMFVSISTLLTLYPSKKEEPKPPQLYVPSYVYKGAITPSTPSHTAASAAHPVQPLTSEPSPQQKIAPTQNKSSLLHSSLQKNTATKHNSLFQQSVLAMSQNMIQQNQINTSLNRMQNSEPPILLVGDKHAIVDPLIRLMGRALSTNFRYPRIEGTFGARGRVLVELTMHPEGYFSDVQILESSNNQNFDAAALYAVNSAPKVVGVDKFLPRAKRFVVGFLFE